jgi:hypothetical protein
MMSDNMYYVNYILDVYTGCDVCTGKNNKHAFLTGGRPGGIPFDAAVGSHTYIACHTGYLLQKG